MRKYRKAFTLIEMIIIIAVLGILAIAALPNLISYSSLRLTGAAYKLASDIKYAQQLSISRQVRCEIVFSPDHNRYNLHYFIEDNGHTSEIQVFDPLTRQPMIVNYNLDSTYKGVDLYDLDPDNLSTLQFDPWGNPFDNSGLLTSMGRIVLRYQNETRTISITPYTGHVEIQ